jgi:hypothetical protein
MQSRSGSGEAYVVRAGWIAAYCHRHAGALRRSRAGGSERDGDGAVRFWRRHRSARASVTAKSVAFAPLMLSLTGSENPDRLVTVVFKVFDGTVDVSLPNASAVGATVAGIVRPVLSATDSADQDCQKRLTSPTLCPAHPA